MEHTLRCACYFLFYNSVFHCYKFNYNNDIMLKFFVLFAFFFHYFIVILFLSNLKKKKKLIIKCIITSLFTLNSCYNTYFVQTNAKLKKKMLLKTVYYFSLNLFKRCQKIHKSLFKIFKNTLFYSKDKFPFILFFFMKDMGLQTNKSVIRYKNFPMNFK